MHVAASRVHVYSELSNMLVKFWCSPEKARKACSAKKLVSWCMECAPLHFVSFPATDNTF